MSLTVEDDLTIECSSSLPKKKKKRKKNMVNYSGFPEDMLLPFYQVFEFSYTLSVLDV